MSLSQKGFTLIEILLVLAVLGIVTAMAIPSFTRSFAQLQLRDAANDVAYVMRYAQSRAINTRRPLKLMFDEQLTSYWLEEAIQESEEGDEEVSVDYKPVSSRLGRKSAVPDGITVEAPNPAIVFTPDGRIEKTQIKVCQKEECLIVSTQNQSGYVNVAEENPK